MMRTVKNFNLGRRKLSGTNLEKIWRLADLICPRWFAFSASQVVGSRFKIKLASHRLISPTRIPFGILPTEKQGR